MGIGKKTRLSYAGIILGLLLIRGTDKDGDQEVSMDELKDFFCGCCSLKKAKKK